MSVITFNKPTPQTLPIKDAEKIGTVENLGNSPLQFPITIATLNNRGEHDGYHQFHSPTRKTLHFQVSGKWEKITFNLPPTQHTQLQKLLTQKSKNYTPIPSLPKHLQS